jgi:predicted RNase H-like HicB family nuclease
LAKASYLVRLTREPEGGYTATVPVLPGCVTYGQSIGEALTMAREAIELYIESLAAHGEAIPTELNDIQLEIDDFVVAQADDGDAWEEPIRVQRNR